MNILSLFDGMSCGRVALERAGIPIDNYFASEIDKYSIEIAKKNYPDTEHVGDVTNLYGFELPEIDLLIGGSPCQGFSFAGKQLAFDDPRSKLFFEFVRLKDDCEPDYFLLENVRMKKEFQDIISGYLGVEPIRINSNLVSAQNRDRFYWTNIPEIEQPEDKRIMLENILEDGVNLVFQKPRGKNKGGEVIGKSPAMTANSWENNVYAARIVGRARENGKRIDHKQSVAGLTTQEIEINKNPNKTNTISTVQKDNILVTGCIEVGHADLNVYEERKRVYSTKGKSPSLLSASGGYHHKKIAVDAKHWRKLTPVECERLQTLPDNYTEGVSNTQRYKMIGNGWTVDVVAHIFDSLYLLI